MRVPDLESDIYEWEVKELRWTTKSGVDMCLYCHQEKHEHFIETDRQTGDVYYICIPSISRKDHAYTGP